MTKKLSALVLLLFVQQCLFAQGGAIGETMRSNGKIYVVAAVALTILTAIFLYHIRLEGKIRRLEQNRS